MSTDNLRSERSTETNASGRGEPAHKTALPLKGGRFSTPFAGHMGKVAVASGSRSSEESELKASLDALDAQTSQANHVTSSSASTSDAEFLDPDGPRLTRLKDPLPVAPQSKGGGTTPGGPREDVLQKIRAAAHKRIMARATQKGINPGRGSLPSRESASPVAVSGTTASQSTLDQYLKRGHELFSRYRRERNIHASAEDISPIEWVNWLLAMKPDLKASTWRVYRQSAYHFLEGFPSHETPSAIGMLDADVIDRHKEGLSEEREGPHDDERTSSLKRKNFPLEDMDKVLTYLRAYSRSKWAPVLIDWLRAGVLTGLRPIEWRMTDIEVRSLPDGRTAAWLYVMNAKATNGRGNGVVRTLDLSEFSRADLDCVQRMVDRSQKWLENDQFSRAKSDCSNLLYSLNKKLWPARKTHFALYSCRHQAIANWKGSDVAPEVIAAIVGHGITATAAEHYGKKRSAWAPEKIPVIPGAVPEELSKVRQRIRLFNDRIKLEKAAGIRREGDVVQYPVG
ncbi:hypothetical protein [Thalassospira xiamenensis]|uniref:Phage integrase family protein n=1 Tax=Thalassospira xiamenensis TaxID=220697 RepID=A0A285TR85_9PROT|nr:hypothetical protein [Thalassospira xiamenensis]SOC25876.1 hypothetical protein SAMN05428964_1055 [Thalassospira xiamenensis]